MTTPLNNAFTALADPERRQLLLALAAHNPQSDQSLDYPEAIQSKSENKENILMRLHHNHLPMLEATGFIEWHKDDREITKGPNFDVIQPLLQVIEETDRGLVANGQ